MTETDGLWRAVDAITAPTKRRLARTEAAEWLEELRTDPGVTVCSVEAYRAATLAYGEIPALWDQAVWAVGTGSESGGGGTSPLRERSPADLDLMETLLTIRESMAWQLPGRGITPKAGMKAQMRQLAAYVGGYEPQHVAWWTFRFGQWTRLLSTHLHALDAGPRPVRLRGAACPLCRTRQVTIEGPSGPVVAPALLIDFTDKWIRAAQCTACGAVWWRGEELNDLADLLKKTDTSFPTEGESTVWSKSASA